jgi:hypothetical protein
LEVSTAAGAAVDSFSLQPEGRRAAARISGESRAVFMVKVVRGNARRTKPRAGNHVNRASGDRTVTG